MPAQARAFHARRKLTHAGEGRELAQLRWVDARVVLREQCVHILEQLLYLRLGLAFDGFRQQRRR